MLVELTEKEFEILKKYLKEDTDTLEHSIEDEYADANGKPGWDKVHASGRTERLKKQAYDSSLATKIANAKKFNGDATTEETADDAQNSIAGVCSVLGSMGIDVDKKHEIDLYEEDNNAYIKPDLGFCKFGNSKCFIDTLIEFTDLKKGKIRMYMSIRKAGGISYERVNCGVPDFKANIKNVSEIKPAILKFVQTCLDKGMNVDKDSYTNRIGEMNKWEKLVKKYNLA